MYQFHDSLWLIAIWLCVHYASLALVVPANWPVMLGTFWLSCKHFKLVCCHVCHLVMFAVVMHRSVGILADRNQPATVAVFLPHEPSVGSLRGENPKGQSLVVVNVVVVPVVMFMSQLLLLLIA